MKWKDLSDKEKWALGIAGSLGSITIGYLVWRHEMTLQLAAQQSQNQQQAAIAQQQAQQLQTELGALGTLGVGGSPTLSGVGISSVPQDNTLSQILAAFLGTGNGSAGTSSPTGSASSGSSNTGSSSSTDIIQPARNAHSPTGGEVPPTQPVGPANWIGAVFNTSGANGGAPMGPRLTLTGGPGPTQLPQPVGIVPTGPRFAIGA